MRARELSTRNKLVVLDQVIWVFRNITKRHVLVNTTKRYASVRKTFPELFKLSTLTGCSPTPSCEDGPIWAREETIDQIRFKCLVALMTLRVDVVNASKLSKEDLYYHYDLVA